MQQRLRNLCLVIFGTLCMPSMAGAQTNSSDSLARRVAMLEHRVLELDQRVRELEGLVKTSPTALGGTPQSVKWEDLRNWRQLRSGMSFDAVRALLGEPERIDGGNIATWYWGSGHAIFMSDKLYRWTEPMKE